MEKTSNRERRDQQEGGAGEWERGTQTEDYKEAMNGIYTSCVNKGTLDESPMAYKPIEEIVVNIEPTAEIVSRIKPIYNFKAGDEE